MGCLGAGHSGGAIYRVRKPSKVSWVACDRGRNLIVWLDGDLIPRELWSVPCPVSMAWSGECLWVACALGGGRYGAHRLICLGRDGRLRGSWKTGPIRGLVSVGKQGGVVMLEDAGGSPTLWKCDGRGDWYGPISVPGAEELRRSANGIYLIGPLNRGAWLPGGSGADWLHFTLPMGLQCQSGVRIQGDRIWCRGKNKSSRWRSWSPESGRWSDPEVRPWLPEDLGRHWPAAVGDLKPPALVAWLDAQGIGSGPGGSWLLRAPEFLWLLDGAGKPRVGQGGFGYLVGAAWVGCTSD